MNRCANCYRYSLGDPAFCPFCGRSFHVKLCPRGHTNPRQVTFCSQCGSSDLSTPAPPGSFWFHLQTALVRVLVRLTPVLLVGAVALAVVRAIDWPSVIEPVLPVLLMLGLLYWVTTLLPAPIRRLGKGAARRLGGAMKGKPKGR